MKIFGYWTILVALVISGVAAYYSIVGLVAIFAAAMMPIVIMGGALEVGKLTTAVWLHTYWDKAAWHIKSYLVVALILLMFITSMGIFGFLSKAHIEQTAAATEGVAQLERLDAQIVRNQDIIARAEQQIEKLDNTNNDVDAGLQAKIDSEQARIDTAYDRIQPSIDEQKQMLEAGLKPYEDQLASANEKLTLLQQYADANDVRALQRLVGARADGQYGPGTASKVDAYRTQLTTERDTALAKMQELRDASATEIQRLRALAEKEIDSGNTVVNRLRDQLGRNDNAEQIAIDIQAQRAKIKEANTEIDTLYEQKYALEGEARKLEAEVGPVKYIAEMVYGEDTTTNTLEQAVRWVIIILVIVFDPLAVVLIIAGITLVEDARKRGRRKDDQFEPLQVAPLEKSEPQPEELQHEAEELQEEIVELKEELEHAIHELEAEKMAMAMDKLNETVDAYNDDRLASKYDLATDWTDDEVEEFLEDAQEWKDTASDEYELAKVIEEPKNTVYTDQQGEYTIDKYGNKKYVYNTEQLDLNNRAKNKKIARQAIERMKAEGYWPASQSESEIEEILLKADPETLEEVYNEITKDLNQKKEI